MLKRSTQITASRVLGLQNASLYIVYLFYCHLDVICLSLIKVPFIKKNVLGTSAQHVNREQRSPTT